MNNNSFPAMAIVVLSIAIVAVLLVIFSPKENEPEQESAEVKETVLEMEQPEELDESVFEIDENDGGLWVIEAMVVPEEWKR